MILKSLDEVELYVCPECLMHTYWFYPGAEHYRRNYIPDGLCPGSPELFRFEAVKTS